MKTKVTIIFCLLLTLLLASCGFNTDSSPQEPDLPTNTPTTAGNTKESNSPIENNSDVVLDANTSGNFWSARGASDFLITQQGDWLFYSYAHVNTSVSPAVSFIGKVPMGGTQGEAVELYQSDEGRIFYLQVVGKWIYWSTDDSIWKITTDGTDMQCVTSEIGNEAFYVSGDWIYYTESTVEKISASSEQEYNYFSRISTDGSQKEILYKPDNSKASIAVRAAISEQQIYFEVFSNRERTFYLFDGSNATACSIVCDSVRQDEKGNLYYCIGTEWYRCLSADLSDGVPYCESSGNVFFAYDSAYYTKSGLMGIFRAQGGGVKDATMINRDYTFLGEGISSPADGYLYYVASGDDHGEVFCRMKPDGTSWEDIGWFFSK